MLQREDEGWGSAFDQIHIKDNKAERHTFTLLSSPPPPSASIKGLQSHTGCSGEDGVDYVWSVGRKTNEYF